MDRRVSCVIRAARAPGLGWLTRPAPCRQVVQDALARVKANTANDADIQVSVAIQNYAHTKAKRARLEKVWHQRRAPQSGI